MKAPRHITAAGSEGRRGITSLDRSGVQGEWRRLWPERRAGWGPQALTAVGEDFRGVGGESCSLAAVERN